MKLAHLTLLLSLGLLCGCGQQPGQNSVTVNGAAFELSAEPEGAIGVIAARNEAKNNESRVIVGRIGGPSPWVEGRAAFMLVDASAVADESEDCCEDCEEGCTKPCCTDKDQVGQTALVKIVDENGRTLEADARELFSLKAKDTVVVRGRVQRDESGNLTVLADGLYVRR